mmetsp:Transcript_5188/g.4400  ORF Transcript_5188/g.4400 Transcript_5188/m.4400 type:complete len:146 (+) Transcript_5188:391-828(+)
MFKYSVTSYNQKDGGKQYVVASQLDEKTVEVSYLNKDGIEKDVTPTISVKVETGSIVSLHASGKFLIIMRDDQKFQVHDLSQDGKLDFISIKIERDENTVIKSSLLLVNDSQMLFFVEDINHVVSLITVTWPLYREDLKSTNIQN